MPGPKGELPIFELPLVLLPTERVPLHIFEPRYQRMIGAAIEATEPFGVLFRDDSGARRVGCAAEVEDVLERFEDGRMNIVARGRHRFRVIERREDPERPRALVEQLDGGDGGSPEQAKQALAELIEAVGVEADAEAVGGEAYAIAAQVELGTAFKQRLLEEESEQTRLDHLAAELRRLAREARRARELSERARSNGRGPVGEVG